MTSVPSISNEAGKEAVLGVRPESPAQSLWTFKTRLVVLVLLVMVPALAIAIFGSFELHRAERNRLKDKAASISSLAAAKEQNFVNNTRQLLATLNQFPFLLLSTNKAFTENHLSNLRKLSPDFANFGLIEKNGEVFATAEATNSAVSLTDRSYFKRVLQTKRFSVGDFQVSRITGQRVVNFGAPVFSESGELIRVLYSSLKIKRLSDELADIPVPEGLVLTVFDRSGNVLARNKTPDQWIGKNLGGEKAVQRIISGNVDSFEMKDRHNVMQLYAVSVVTDGLQPSFFVAVTVPPTLLFARLNQLLISYLALLGIGALSLWFIIHFYLRRFFYRPMDVLSGAAMRLAGGDLSARTGLSEGTREIIQLSQALDGMAASVEQQTIELKNTNAALRVQMDERERTEQQLLRSQRTECIGAIAGGVAHDLNNALVPILMGSEMLKESIGEQPESLPLLKMITDSARRCSDMVKQVVTFARGTGGQIDSVPVRQLLSEMVQIARETFPKNITIQYKIQPDLFSVNGNATELHQVVMNLCVNARDAMPEGGTLSLTAENAKSAPELLPAAEEGRGALILIKVKDTGTGIPVQLHDRIFEPFFTTKAPGKGSGLGLSTVAAVIKRHKGIIELDSEPGKGTEFRIYLPATPKRAEDQPKPSTRPSGNGELILLADDEQLVIELSKSILESYGYRVLTAANGVEAIARFESHRNQIRLVITDTDMPFLTGRSAAKSIRNQSPDVPIIVASATKSDTAVIHKEDLGNLFTLTKPYGVENLLNAVAEALHKSNQAKS